MPKSRTRPNSATQRRELQTQIERSRRRLERNVGRLVDRTLFLGSWQTYVKQHPGRSLLAAAGVGMALSGVISRFPLPKDLADKICNLAVGAGWQQALADIHAVFDRARRSDSTGPKHHG